MRHKKLMSKRHRRILAAILREAADLSDDPFDAARRIVYWWPTLDIGVKATTVEMALALTGFGCPTDIIHVEQTKLFKAVQFGKKPPLRPDFTMSASSGETIDGQPSIRVAPGQTIRIRPNDNGTGWVTS